MKNRGARGGKCSPSGNMFLLSDRGENLLLVLLRNLLWNRQIRIPARNAAIKQG